MSLSAAAHVHRRWTEGKKTGPAAQHGITSTAACPCSAHGPCQQLLITQSLGCDILCQSRSFAGNPGIP